MSTLVDRLIYTAMTGAKYLLERQATLAHNLANASTTGFRADTVGLRAVPTTGQAAGTRVFPFPSISWVDPSAWGTAPTTACAL